MTRTLENLKIGQVYLFKQTPVIFPGLDPEKFNIVVRVLFFNSELIYYETFDPDSNVGLFTKDPGRTSYYYRTPPDVFLESSSFIKTVELTAFEKKIIRPDLPINIFPISLNFKWSDKKYENQEEIIETLKNEIEKIHSIDQLNAPKIVVISFAKKYGAGKSAIIHADNKKFFSPIELLFKCNNIQGDVLTKDSIEFKGVFRAGHEKGIPSFSIVK